MIYYCDTMNIKNVKFLSNSEKDNLNRIFIESYGVRINTTDFEFFVTAKEKVWVTTKKAKIMVKKLPNPIYMGLMIGKLKTNNKIKLSIEGSQLIGNEANKNIIEIENCTDYIFGGDPIIVRKISVENHSFPLVKCSNYYLGSVGYISENKVINLFPTSRRKLVKNR